MTPTFLSLVERAVMTFPTSSSVPLNEENLKSVDCVVLVTDHSAYDMDEIVRHSQLVIDTRNATRGIACATTKVVRC